ncbi:hypothetical protein L2E82_20251 [Cichorium intybus]|uniref:Uncharacterized protein n=1 Tax=Cichorium intybus TaxID=13427 RepID=A0ACB9DTU0_CICIN|nr:hypothetical protein L2E82_20251 [Cichorium intybus]
MWERRSTLSSRLSNTSGDWRKNQWNCLEDEKNLEAYGSICRHQSRGEDSGNQVHMGCGLVRGLEQR